jgi:hypothetical protein
MLKWKTNNENGNLFSDTRISTTQTVNGLLRRLQTHITFTNDAVTYQSVF